MKCRACDEILTDQEAIRKDSYNIFVDLCFICYPVDLDQQSILNPLEEEEIDKFLEEELEKED